MTHDHEQCRRVAAIRRLALDMITRAGSGHVGVALGFAPVIDALFSSVMRFAPAWDTWPGRDRFVLSAGHASALLYAALHVHGFAIAVDDLRQFRKLGSRTPGHPERGCVPGVEVTTGPLGQGLATAVGLAIGQRRFAERHRGLDPGLFEYRTFCAVSDGDLQEGVAREAISLAGIQRLERLVVVHDDNGTQAESFVAGVSADDLLGLFHSCGWRVLGPVDAGDTRAMTRLLQRTRERCRQPTYVAVRTMIGWGSPRQGHPDAHGWLAAADLALARDTCGGSDREAFASDPAIELARVDARRRGARRTVAWLARWRRALCAAPLRAAQVRGELSDHATPAALAAMPDASAATATTLRHASGQILKELAARHPHIVVGSADLARSTGLDVPGRIDFGVREHAMAAAASGLALSGAFPVVSTYLAFADYLRPALRLAAMMRLRCVYVLTHDSIGVGEDGPTHQPVEQLMNLRAVPGLRVVRPADLAELRAAWQLSLADPPQPTALILSRQDAGSVRRHDARYEDLARGGGYVVVPEPGPKIDVILIATGSEVAIAIDVAARLAQAQVSARVVSMPCWSEFDAQPATVREAVLPIAIRARVAIEAGIPLGWEHYVGLDGLIVGVEDYGASGAAEQLYRLRGLDSSTITRRVLEWLARHD